MRHFFAGASVLVSGGRPCFGYLCDGRNHVCNNGFVVHHSGNVLIHCIFSLSAWFVFHQSACSYWHIYSVLVYLLICTATHISQLF